MTHGPHFGLLDNRFLARSVGLLDPGAPLTIREDDSLGRALTVLRDNKVGCVVVTAANGELKGIFTERDVLLKLDFKQLDETRPIREFMTAHPRTVEMTAPIAFVLQLMSEGGFRHVPIIDEERLPVGIVSVKDIIDYIVSSVTKDLHSFE
ncbi:MAG: CBS domain-containing protein [Bdellovibrionales bacterium]|nr:CBS domain-containing protein [Bdellovibrionales bacterium]